MGRRDSKPTRAEAGGQRARKKRDKLERLRAAAWELFATKGFDATTTREIAERAGVATGTLFLYAKDKPDLLFLVHGLGEPVFEDEEQQVRLVLRTPARRDRG